MNTKSEKTHQSGYWQRQYETGHHNWNIGYVSTPLKEYFDQLTNKELRILVPGAGFGWESGYLYENGFRNTFALDFSKAALEKLTQHHPFFPKLNILQDDFFEHQGLYDLLVEQTFFSSIPRERRNAYAMKTHSLLRTGGKLVGLLFNHEFQSDSPPFGGSAEEYESVFRPYFHFRSFAICYNSIKPRKGRELFILLEKK